MIKFDCLEVKTTVHSQIVLNPSLSNPPHYVKKTCLKGKICEVPRSYLVGRVEACVVYLSWKEIAFNLGHIPSMRNVLSTWSHSTPSYGATSIHFVVLNFTFNIWLMYNYKTVAARFVIISDDTGLQHVNKALEWFAQWKRSGWSFLFFYVNECHIASFYMMMNFYNCAHNFMLE